jgi:hypothetical protein
MHQVGQTMTLVRHPGQSHAQRGQRGPAPSDSMAIDSAPASVASQGIQARQPAAAICGQLLARRDARLPETISKVGASVVSRAFTVAKRRQRRRSSPIERQAGRGSNRIGLTMVITATRCQAPSIESRKRP